MEENLHSTDGAVVGPADSITSVSDLESLTARVESMKAELLQLEAAGRGLADAHSRATREIKLRQAVEVQRATAEAETTRLREELKAHEASRLSADRASQENAEIANQVRFSWL